MVSGRFRFGDFELDAADRRLLRDGAPVELNARYLDALSLLVGEQGRLVSKERFLDEVWRGVPVTDEALTQCIRTLRQRLGDEAARPKFIETVPKHGYRFVAAVKTGEIVPKPDAIAPRGLGQLVLTGGAGVIGGGLAGLVGGLFYGFAGASQPLQPGMGAVSVLLVIVCVTILVALIGALGVATGIAAARAKPEAPAWWTIAGGAAGGLIIGTIVKLLGIDAFNLLLGRSPGAIAGPLEGLLLGGTVGTGAWLGLRRQSLRRAIALAALCGAVGGIVIALLGGRLMGGSLDSLARSFPGSRLRLDEVGALFGEQGFGPLSQIVTAGLEGALFAAGIVGAMALARRQLGKD